MTVDSLDPPEDGATPKSLGVRIATLEAFLKLGRFRPASVQRSFRWTAENALQLLRDLDQAAPWAPEGPEVDDAGSDGEDAEEAEPELLAPEASEASPGGETAEAGDGAEPSALFLGSVVLSEGAEAWIDIYDGLQRTTTLTMIAAILRDFEDERPAKQALQRLIETDAGLFRLRLQEQDETLRNHVQVQGGTRRFTKLTANRPVGKRLQEVKNALLQEISGWERERRRSLASFLREGALLAVIEAPDPVLARQIFVSTNLHGKRLELLEVLKGQLVSEARTPEEEAAVLAIWEDIGRAVDDQKFGPPRKDRRGRAPQPGDPDPETLPTPREQFLKAYDMIVRTTAQLPQWPTDLGEHIRRASRDQGPMVWMNDLRRCALGWQSLDRILHEPAASAVEREIWRLRFLPWDDWRPLALVLWNRYAAKRGRAEAAGDARGTADLDRKYCGIFARLHERSMLIALAVMRDANRARLFAKAMRTAKAGGDPTTKTGALGVDGGGVLFPTNDQRNKADRTLRGQIKDHKLWRAVILWLEASVWRDGLPELMRSASAEHLLPRNPKPSTRQRIETAGHEYDPLCFALGNLAAMSWAANDTAGDGDFAEKRLILKRESARFRLLADVAAEPVWSAPQIERRTETLRRAFWTTIGLKEPGAGGVRAVGAGLGVLSGPDVPSSRA